MSDSEAALAQPIVEVDRPDTTLPGGISLFFLGIGLLAVLRIAIGYISLPLAWLPTVNLVVAILFLSVPIVSLFFGSNARWTLRTALAFVVGGLVVQFGIIGLGQSVSLPAALAGVLIAIAQGALACWCVGLGALLATGIREKNIILPIAIFLAGYDFFLVLAPVGFTKQLLKVAQPMFTKVAGQIPIITSKPTHGLAQAGAYVGMADLVFLAMFFIALFRFGMRTRATLAAVLPALVAYLLIVMLFGNQEIAGFSLGQLPAMVPIGLTVLIVNWREFQLKKDEKIATAVLAVLVVAVVGFIATRPKPQAELEKPASAQGAPAPAGSRG